MNGVNGTIAFHQADAISPTTVTVDLGTRTPLSWPRPVNSSVVSAKFSNTAFPKKTQGVTAKRDTTNDAFSPTTVTVGLGTW